MSQEVGVRSVDELQQFGRQLKAFSEELSAQFHVANQRMLAVSDGWNDQANQRFMEEFQKDVQDIDKIAARMQDYAAYIAKSCEILEMFKQTRI